MEQNLLDPKVPSQPHLRILIQETFEEILEIRGEVEMLGDGEFLVEDGIVDLVVVFGVVGREAGDELVEEGAEAVVIQREGVALSG